MHEGTIFNVATMAAEPGARVELRDVLLVSNGGDVTVGSPLVADALVLAEVLEHGKGRKVVNFKYKAKVRYRRKRGHRQGYTRLAVQEIRLGDLVATAPVWSSAPAAIAEEAPVEAATAEGPESAPAAEPESEASAAPTRRRRTAATGTSED